MWVKQENCNNRHKKVINGTIVQLEDKELEQNKESEQAMEQKLTDETEEKYLPPDRKAVGV